MIMRRRYINNKKELEDFLIRFYPAGVYTWTVPAGCTEVDVFLVGDGGSGGSAVDSIKGGSEGSNGDDSPSLPVTGGRGQNHTTRDFGDPTGKRNAGGGTSVRNGGNTVGGISDYDEGSGEAGIGINTYGYLPSKSGGGYGGGAGSSTAKSAKKKRWLRHRPYPWQKVQTIIAYREFLIHLSITF